jgi:hypothetical protein
MTQKKERMPLGGNPKSTRKTAKNRHSIAEYKYTNYTIEIPLNFEIVLINGMEGVSIISCRMKGFSKGAFGAFAAFFMNTLL